MTWSSPITDSRILRRSGVSTGGITGSERNAERGAQRLALARSLPAGTPLIDASTSSIGWSAGSGLFARRRAFETWTRQPGFALAYALRTCREHVSCLAVAELARSLRLRDAVDPGRAAADVLLGGLDDLEAWNPRERGVHRERKTLRVPQMARILNRHLQRERVPRCAWWGLGEELARRRGPWRRTPRPARHRGASRAPSGASRSRRS